MSEHPVTVRPGEVAAEAARLMERHQVGCLMVVADNGKLAGVVGRRDLLRIFLRPDEDVTSQLRYAIDDTTCPEYDEPEMFSVSHSPLASRRLM